MGPCSHHLIGGSSSERSAGKPVKQKIRSITHLFFSLLVRVGVRGNETVDDGSTVRLELRAYLGRIYAARAVSATKEANMVK
jgi:hypothetical protein